MTSARSARVKVPASVRLMVPASAIFSPSPRGNEKS
jgi:hypothetical protein